MTGFDGAVALRQAVVKDSIEERKIRKNAAQKALQKVKDRERATQLPLPALMLAKCLNMEPESLPLWMHSGEPESGTTVLGYVHHLEHERAVKRYPRPPPDAPTERSEDLCGLFLWCLGLKGAPRRGDRRFIRDFEWIDPSYLEEIQQESNARVARLRVPKDKLLGLAASLEADAADYWKGVPREEAPPSPEPPSSGVLPKWSNVTGAAAKEESPARAPVGDSSFGYRPRSTEINAKIERLMRLHENVFDQIVVLSHIIEFFGQRVPGGEGKVLVLFGELFDVMATISDQVDKRLHYARQLKVLYYVPENLQPRVNDDAPILLLYPSTKIREVMVKHEREHAHERVRQRVLAMNALTVDTLLNKFGRKWAQRGCALGKATRNKSLLCNRPCATAVWYRHARPPCGTATRNRRVRYALGEAARKKKEAAEAEKKRRRELDPRFAEGRRA